MRKIPVFIFVAVLVLVLVVSIAKGPIAKAGIERGVGIVTGLKLDIGSVDIGVITTLVGISDLKLLNPPGFQDEIMLDMPEIYVDYNLPAIIGGKVHLREVRLNMSEFLVVKNDQGELNINALNVVREQKGERKPTPAEKAKAPEIQIDVLELKVGRVIYKDYSRGGKPAIQEFRLNLDERYTNIDDPNKLVSLIVVKALANTAIARMADFDLKGLEGTIGDTLATAQQLTGQVKEVFSGTKETVQQAAEDLKSVIGFPFGREE